MNDSLKLHVQQITKLPTIPAIAQEILGIVNDDKTSVAKLENIIHRDPSISAKILSVANSAFFGFTIPTATISNAIIRIGFNNVKNIALGISLMTVLDDRNPDLKSFYKSVFKHSATVGASAKFISDSIKLEISEEILLNGLLHDIGLLVLNRYFPDSYKKVLDIFKKEKSLLTAEKMVLGFTHVDIGAWLGEQWNLPNPVLDTIFYHHTPSSAKKNLKHVAITHIADYITNKNICSVTKKDPAYPFDNSSLDILDITENDLKYIEAKTSDDIFSEDIFEF